MNIERNIDLLIHSLDHEMDDSQQERLVKALAASAELRAEKERLLNIRNAIEQLRVGASPLFVDRVMSNLHQSAEKMEAKIIQLFPKVAAACVAFFILTFLMLLVTEVSFTTDALVGVENLTPEDAYSLLE